MAGNSLEETQRTLKSALWRLQVRTKRCVRIRRPHKQFLQVKALDKQGTNYRRRWRRNFHVKNGSERHHRQIFMKNRKVENTTSSSFYILMKNSVPGKCSACESKQ